MIVHISSFSKYLDHLARIDPFHHKAIYMCVYINYFYVYCTYIYIYKYWSKWSYSNCNAVMLGVLRGTTLSKTWSKCGPSGLTVLTA